MSENEGPSYPGLNIEKSAKRLARFYDGDLGQAAEAISSYLLENPLASKGEIFRALSAGKGRPSTHASAEPDTGELIGSGHRNLGRRKSNRRPH